MERMRNYCGADCESCPSKADCRGCMETGGSPFGGRCVAAEYIKFGGMEAYRQFKRTLLDEINTLLADRGLGAIDGLFELAGQYVNLEYPMPSGEKVKLLNDKNIYLGAQIEFADLGICYGVVADTGFILLCSYSVNGSEPELVAYRKR
ncbi:MAG: DUF3795 domain-containing protein [Oscillospiraceae bacterium]|nr:DUF3795 domain-containing protein [Oscillospiraceae bacterium]